MAVYLIAYSYYPQYEKKFFSLVDSLVQACNVEKVVYVFAGHGTRADFSNQLRPDSVVLTHDNRGWEFGAYQRGMDAVHQELGQGDVVIVLNDTTGVHSIFDRGMRKALQESIQRYCMSTEPVIIGEVDAVNDSLQVLQKNVGQWVRSCVFALNYEAVKALDGIIYDKEIAKGISVDSLGALVFSEGLVNEAMAEHVSHWIKAGKRVKANSKPAGSYFLVNKSASTINEKYLSAVVVKAGGKVVDVCDRRFFPRLAFRAKRKMMFLLGKN